MTIYILFLTKQHIMIADKFFKLRHITSYNTIKGYNLSFKLYEEFNNSTLEIILQEAEEEEDKVIPLKHRTIKQRLTNFQIYLSEHYKYNSIKTHMARIKTFYKTFEIELPYLPQLKVVPTLTTTFEEILTKDEIKYAFEHTNNHKLKAMILFMISSGTSVSETLRLTIQDFINATEKYHNSNEIQNVIYELEKQEEIIPTFFIVREKKKRPYYTFCSTEAVKYILIYLKHRLYKKTILSTEQLFEYTVQGSLSTISRLNDSCNFPRKKNGYRKFHFHGFRKFFATHMKEAGMEKYDINFLSGRKADRVTEAYFQIRPESRLQKYKRFMNAVTIFDEINYIDITSQEKRHYDELKKEVHDNKLENEKIKSMLYDLKKLL